MTLLNVSGQLLSFAAAHGADEICKMIPGFWFVVIDFYQGLPIPFALGEKLPVLDHSLFKIKFIRDLPWVFLRKTWNGFVIDQAPRLEQQKSAAEIEHGHQLIWRLAL